MENAHQLPQSVIDKIEATVPIETPAQIEKRERQERRDIKFREKWRGQWRANNPGGVWADADQRKFYMWSDKGILNRIDKETYEAKKIEIAEKAQKAAEALEAKKAEELAAKEATPVVESAPVVTEDTPETVTP